MECFVCHKHSELDQFTGPVIAEAGGMILTHFPFIADEPASAGRLLIEPLRHIADFSEMTGEEARGFATLVREGERRLKTELKATHVYLFRINDKVKHLHFHLVPRFADTPQEFFGLNIFKWIRGTALSLEQIQALAEKLKNSN